MGVKPQSHLLKLDSTKRIQTSIEKLSFQLETFQDGTHPLVPFKDHIMLNLRNIRVLDLKMEKYGAEPMLSFNLIPTLNGIKLQISESLTHTLSTERLTPVMVSNSEDGLTHSAGLILVRMMIKLFFNSTPPSEDEIAIYAKFNLDYLRLTKLINGK